MLRVTRAAAIVNPSLPSRLDERTWSTQPVRLCSELHNPVICSALRLFRGDGSEDVAPEHE
jgi:hypothetical protein